MWSIFALCGPNARAQQQFDTRANLPFPAMDSGLVLRDIAWGWKGDMLPAERHAPVRIWLDSGDVPISGTISIDYQQDSGQNARHVAQFATTPGKGTLVEFAICIKSQLERGTITINDGDATLKIPLSQFPGRSELGLPGSDRGRLRFVSVRVPSVSAVVNNLTGVQTPQWNQSLSDDQVRDYAFSNASVERLVPSNLPTSWMAYESVDALIISEDDLIALPQRQRDAIDAWVVSGGRMIVLIAGAGEGWRRAVPQTLWSEVPRESISFGEATKAPLPAKFGREFQREAKRDSVTPTNTSPFPPLPGESAKQVDQQSSDTDDPDLDDSESGALADESRTSVTTEPTTATRIAPGLEAPPNDEHAATPGVLKVVSGRVATLSPTARNSGWHPLAADAKLAEGESASGLFITGPVGFGTVTLLGADPDRFASYLSDTVAASAWRTTLTAVLPSDAIEQFRVPADQYGWFQSSGETQVQQAGIRACMDLITSARPVSPWFFVITAISMFIMALLVGPVGRIILKRKGLLTRSWIVAIALIAVASVLSVLAPRIVRSGQSMIGRLTVHDVRCDQSGKPTRVATTHLVTMFSGKPESLPPLDGFDPKNPSLEEGSWWRGVSSVQGYESAPRFSDPLTMFNTSPVPGVLRSAAAVPVSMGQWTFRAALQQVPAKTPTQQLLMAELRSEGSVHIASVPKGKRIDAVWLYNGTSGVCVSRDGLTEANLQLSRNDASVASVDVVANSRDLPVELMNWLAAIPTQSGNYYQPVNVSPPSSEAALPYFCAMLPGVSSRSQATQMLVESGWVLVVVALSDKHPADSTSSRATQRFDVYRLTVPRKSQPASPSDKGSQ